MKVIHWIILSLTMIASIWFVYRTRDSRSRVEIPVNLNWSFIQGEQEGASAVDYNDASWQILSVPHDWMILYPVDKSNPSGLAGGFYPGGIGWYRKNLDLAEYDDMDRFYLIFEGVYMNADIYFNGTHLGRQNYGYASFYHDVSDLVRMDSLNVIAVRTDCSKLPVDRWYSGAGIYRPVHMVATRDLHIPVWGASVTSQIDSARNAEMEVSLELENHGRKGRRFEVRYDIVNNKGKLVAESKASAYVRGRSADTLRHHIRIEKPGLWSPDSPELYTVNCYLLDGSRQIDHIKINHGFRSVDFDPDRGFILNGEKLMMKGVCLHHDGGELGAAVPIESWKRRFENLKKLGVNALRLAHNPHAPGVLDLADQMGFLVIDEMYDKWSRDWPGAAGNIGIDSTWEKDLENFIKRDRNHPSVVLWSVGNETMEQLDDPQSGVAFYNKLMQRVKSVDPGREVTCAMHPGNPDDGQEIPSRMMGISPVVSYNYRTDSFATWHSQHPDLVFIASETKAYATQRPEDYHQIDFSNNSWNDMEEFVAGQFIWAGIDYLGESPSWPERGFSKGLMQTNGFIKPHAWYIASCYRDDPMVKLTVKDDVLADSLNAARSWQASWEGPPLVDHWSFQEQPGKKEVIIFTNCEQVELELNGNSLGRIRRDEFSDGVIRSELPYEEGNLIARAFYKDQRGREIWVADTLTTAHSPYTLALRSDRRLVHTDKPGVVHITTEVRDSTGTLNPHSRLRVDYRVDGPGKIQVIDNGDLGEQAIPGASSREVRKGKQLLILKAGNQPGDVIIRASADGVKSSSVKIKTKK